MIAPLYAEESMIICKPFRYSTGEW